MSEQALMALIYAFCGMNSPSATTEIRENKIACMEDVLNCAIKGPRETELKEDKLKKCLKEQKSD